MLASIHDILKAPASVEQVKHLNSHPRLFKTARLRVIGNKYSSITSQYHIAKALLHTTADRKQLYIMRACLLLIESVELRVVRELHGKSCIAVRHRPERARVANKACERYPGVHHVPVDVGGQMV
eukprot:1426744-Pleurochrysis_carterae.AAC.7